MRCRHRAATFYAATRARPPSRSVTVGSAAVRTISAAGEGAYTSAPTRTRRRSRRSRVAVYSCLSRWGFSPSFAHMPRRMSHAACHTQGVTRRVSHAACHTQHATRRMSHAGCHPQCHTRCVLEISWRFPRGSPPILAKHTQAVLGRICQVQPEQSPPEKLADDGWASLDAQEKKNSRTGNPPHATHTHTYCTHMLS